MAFSYKEFGSQPQKIAIVEEKTQKQASPSKKKKPNLALTVDVNDQDDNGLRASKFDTNDVASLYTKYQQKKKDDLDKSNIRPRPGRA